MLLQACEHAGSQCKRDLCVIASCAPVQQLCGEALAADWPCWVLRALDWRAQELQLAAVAVCGLWQAVGRRLQQRQLLLLAAQPRRSSGLSQRQQPLLLAAGSGRWWALCQRRLGLRQPRACSAGALLPLGCAGKQVQGVALRWLPRHQRQAACTDREGISFCCQCTGLHAERCWEAVQEAGCGIGRLQRLTSSRACSSPQLLQPCAPGGPERSAAHAAPAAGCLCQLHTLVD